METKVNDETRYSRTQIRIAAAKKNNQSDPETNIKQIKSSLHSGITPKRVTSGGAHLRGSAPRQHNSEETSRRWRAVGDTAFAQPGPGIELTTSSADSNVFNRYANRLSISSFHSKAPMLTAQLQTSI